MSSAGCTQPHCLFEGDWLNSPAEPGRCTLEPGYIANAEIDEIISAGDDVMAWHDDASDSDIAVYDGMCLVASGILWPVEMSCIDTSGYLI
jgi:hypothetical protein